jgi:hypothetical protein
MVEQWTLDDLESKIKSQELLSLSSKSAVYKYELNDGRIIIGKSYDHYDTPEYKKAFKDKTSLVDESFYKNPRHYFKKELKVLSCYSKTNVAPQPIAFIKENLLILMEYIDGKPFSDLFVEEEIKFIEGSTKDGKRPQKRELNIAKNKLRDKLVENLENYYKRTAPLHKNIVKQCLDKYGNYTEKNHPTLKIRGQYEEKTRFRHAVYKMVYGFSKEFKEENPQLYNEQLLANRDTQNKLWKKAKIEIKKYLKTKEIIFEDFVTDFLGLYHNLVYGHDKLDNKITSELLKEGKIRAILGDAGPQNFIYVQNKRGKLIDFNESRLANPHLDVVSALFNIYSMPTESRIPRYIRNFWQETPQIKESYPDFHEFHAGCMATRLYKDFLIAANNSDFSDIEIERFAAGHPRFDDLTKENRNMLFKKDRIVDMLYMFPYYMFEDGYKVVLEPSPKKNELRELLNLTREFLHKTYIGLLPTEKYIGIRVDEIGTEGSEI